MESLISNSKIKELELEIHRLTDIFEKGDKN
jgi:hypothetical protein